MKKDLQDRAVANEREYFEERIAKGKIDLDPVIDWIKPALLADLPLSHFTRFSKGTVLIIYLFLHQHLFVYYRHLRHPFKYHPRFFLTGLDLLISERIFAISFLSSYVSCSIENCPCHCIQPPNHHQIPLSTPSVLRSGHFYVIFQNPRNIHLHHPP